MIQTIELFPGITLRCFPDKRFKQGLLSIQFLRPMCPEEAALNALLPAVLLRGTAQHPDMRSIILHLDDLYGAAVGTQVRRIGDVHTTGLTCSFIDDKYALPGDAVLQPMLRFLRELLLEPALENGCFRADFVEGEKRNLLLTIESQLNDKRAYAAAQMLKKLCPEDAFGAPRLGEPEQVKAITPQSLFAHYQKVLRESCVHIFYTGSAEPEALCALLRQELIFPDRTALPMPGQTPLRAGTPGSHQMTMDVAQGKLAVGFVTPITFADPRFAAMQVCNTVLGSGMISKLFMQIREKLSLCYDISSGYYGSKGIVTVSAGIDCDKDAMVCGEIMKQVEQCVLGNISQEELSAAKQAILSGLRATHDSPGAIESYYSTAAISGLSMTPDAYAEAVSRVSVEDVASAAATLEKHTVFFLKGAQ